MNRFLPYSRQTIDEDDIAAVSAVLRSDFLTTGAESGLFEEELQQWMQVPEAIAVNSGTAALHLAWQAIGLEAGDKVIVPAVTFLSAASTALLCGAEVIFADCDPDTGLMNEETIRQAAGLDENIKAICVVHLNGQFAPMAEIKRLADEKGWKIIEDAAHILGGMQHGEDDRLYSAGSCHFSDFTVFSTHAVKNITTGEGGIITCKDADLARKMRDWRSHGMVRDVQYYQFPEHAEKLWYHEMQMIGANYRLTDFQAVLGRSQLGKLTKFIEARAEIMTYYYAQLAGFTPNIILVPQIDTGIPAWHLCASLIDFAAIGKSREFLMQKLRDDGIGTQLHYIPLYRQPFFKQRYGVIHLEGAEKYSARALSLPLFPEMNHEDVMRVVESLKKHLEL